MSNTHAHAGNRHEDLRLITGRGRYTSDWNLPDQNFTNRKGDSLLKSERPGLAHGKVRFCLLGAKV